MRLANPQLESFQGMLIGGDPNSPLLFMKDARLHWKLRPSVETKFLNTTVRTNRQGFRGAEPKSAEQDRAVPWRFDGLRLFRRGVGRFPRPAPIPPPHAKQVGPRLERDQRGCARLFLAAGSVAGREARAAVEARGHHPLRRQQRGLAGRTLRSPDRRRSGRLRAAGVAPLGQQAPRLGRREDPSRTASTLHCTRSQEGGAAGQQGGIRREPTGDRRDCARGARPTDSPRSARQSLLAADAVQEIRRLGEVAELFRVDQPTRRVGRTPGRAGKDRRRARRESRRRCGLVAQRKDPDGHWRRRRGTGVSRTGDRAPSLSRELQTVRTGRSSPASPARNDSPTST